MSELATVDGGAAEAEVEDNAELRQRVKSLADQAEQTYWDLAMALEEVHATSAYVAWGYTGFKEYVEGELDFGIRKTQYFIGLAQWFKTLNKATQEWVARLGWSKAKELVGKVTNENAAEWKKKLENKTVTEIKDMLKDAGGDDGGDSSGESSEGGTAEKASRKSFSLFPEQMDNVDAALKKAIEISKSDKEGHNLDLICTDFLATNAAYDDVREYLKKVESVTGIKLIGYDPKEKEIIYGDTLLDEIAFEPDDDGDGDDEEVEDDG